MRHILLLDTAEIALRHLPKGKQVDTVSVWKLLADLKTRNYSSYNNLSYGVFKDALRQVFPLYKNRRRRSKRFRISEQTAYKVLSDRGLVLRPVEHIRNRDHAP